MAPSDNTKLMRLRQRILDRKTKVLETVKYGDERKRLNRTEELVAQEVEYLLALAYDAIITDIDQFIMETE